MHNATAGRLFCLQSGLDTITRTDADLHTAARPSVAFAGVHMPANVRADVQKPNVPSWRRPANRDHLTAR